MNLEHDLREALKRKDPSREFDIRVQTRIASGGRPAAPDRPVGAHKWMLPLAASLLIAMSGAYYMQYPRVADAPAPIPNEGEHARRAAQDVVTALAIASEKVSAVRAKVQEMTHHERSN